MIYLICNINMCMNLKHTFSCIYTKNEAIKKNVKENVNHLQA